MAGEVVVGPLRDLSRGGHSEIRAHVGGTPVWFASDDVRLEPSAEAFASALLLPAVRRRRSLRVSDGQVCRTWRENVRRLLRIWRDWWGYPVLEPVAQERGDDGSPSTGTALCFTGGVDSFYSLLRCAPWPDALVFVEGYDIPLHDEVRLTEWRAAMARVASETATRSIRVRSNLRTHPLVSRSQWDRAHGGALAAVGHLLAPIAGTLAIASGAPTRYGYAWGSHEYTDGLWSSDRLRVVHQGASASRIDKVQAIVDEPLVQRHLRVCWENRAAHGNCSACDKCVCTMATIVACGDPGRFTSFNWSIPVERRMERLRETRFVITYAELLERPLPPSLRSSVERLLRRNVLPARVRALWQRWRG